jgi:hypothetical protein
MRVLVQIVSYADGDHLTPPFFSCLDLRCSFDIWPDG